MDIPCQQVLMHVLRDKNLGVEAICGGTCSCGTCHVVFDDASFAQLRMPSAAELVLLDSLNSRRTNSRLSCQIEVTKALEGATVTVIPPE